ncbi:MAG: plasma-membrane proton-efflux P-type ATPase [Sphingobacteriales bacterium]|uniref:plasma-membrane proton-efflux P-type ATPase n=1 Tax=Hydrotalea flava TaxID=714549 RepID=UPI00082C6B85|nr:plasma-membrane proton-efflux P-type ATPase [Hydrotalea flava]RTL49975.1 MAG: plasma-membrane proton-efflux P-type ATPase [Sphingobacteriales bacterium]
MSDVSLQDQMKAFGTDVRTGLSDAQVAALHLKYGANEVVEKKPSAILLFLRHFWGLTAWMLEATVVISFILHRNFDGWLIAGLLFFNGLLGFLQELKAAKTVESLKTKLTVMVRALRNAIWVNLPSRAIVPGDVLRIRTGDFLVADMQIIEGNIQVDKSALTGESALIKAAANDNIYSGSIVKNGECTALVTATAANTVFGKTAGLIMAAKHKMHMEEIVGKVVQILFSIVVVVLGITVLDALLGGAFFLTTLPLILILLVSAVPIGLPAMFTISMAKASQELSEKGLLVSRLSATEDAATLTTLCIDKTGTITENKLSLQEMKAAKGFSENEVLLYGMLASVAANNDAIDEAFFQKFKTAEITSNTYQQKTFVPFSAATKRTEAMIVHNNDTFVVLKGAYVTIQSLCTPSLPELDATVEVWAGKGFKTIAVAIQKDNTTQLVGIAALYDPPRPDSAGMLSAIKELGVTVKMLTGDALPVAKEIALRAGVGSRIIAINDVRAALQHSGTIIQQYDGFAEVLPEDKYNIVKILQQEKQITGMTGDGVNDAPALKQAEVGIAVSTATDVAKQAASIILLQDGLKQIVDLIRVGRITHVRISNYTVNKIAKTLQTILFVCGAFLITKTFVVGAIDMVLMLFLIDFVVLALATDKVQWSKLPANWNIKPMVIKGFVLGVLLFAECLVWFLWASHYFQLLQPETAHTLGFATLFYSGICAVLTVRTNQRFYQEPISKTLLWVIIADMAVVLVLLQIGFTGFTALPILPAISTVLYFLFCNLIVNDVIKVWLLRTLDVAAA